MTSDVSICNNAQFCQTLENEKGWTILTTKYKTWKISVWNKKVYKLFAPLLWCLQLHKINFDYSSCKCLRSPIIRCDLVPKQVKTLPKDWVILNFRSLVETPLMMFKTGKGAAWRPDVAWSLIHTFLLQSKSSHSASLLKLLILWFRSRIEIVPAKT